MFPSLKACMGFSIFDSVSFSLNFTFLFKKKHDGVSVARKKYFDSSRVTGSVFSSQTIVFRYLKLVKRPASKRVSIDFLRDLDILILASG